MSTPDVQASIWLKTLRRPTYVPLSGKLNVDCVVVGGGITGLTAAMLLRREGVRVALIEAGRIAGGASGATSAHLTEVPDVDYVELREQLGLRRATTAVLAWQRGLSRIRRFVDELGIDCCLDTVPAWRFSEQPGAEPLLQQEAACARELGVQATFTRDVPLPFPVTAAIQFDRQAQFHPAKYLRSLCARLAESGGLVFERTPLVRVQEHRGGLRVETPRGLLACDLVVLATQAPVAPISLPVPLSRRRTYMVAVRMDRPPPPGLFWSAERAYHYVRSHAERDATYLLAGGEDHDAGTELSPATAYARLEAFVRTHFLESAVAYAWTEELHETADGLPYIGPASGSRRIHVATGYSGCGLVQGTLAGMLLRDRLLGRRSLATALFGSIQRGNHRAPAGVDGSDGSREPKERGQTAPL